MARAEPGVPVHEQTTPRPAALYGVTKLAGTRLVELAAAGGLAAWCCACSTRSARARRIPACPAGSPPNCAGSPGRGRDVRLGALDAVRDLVDVRDVADAVLAAATAPALPAPGDQRWQRSWGAGAGDGQGTARDQRVRAARFVRMHRACRARPTYHGSRPTSRVLPKILAGRRTAISRPRSPICGGNPLIPRAADGTELVIPRLIVPAYFHPATPPGRVGLAG